MNTYFITLFNLEDTARFVDYLENNDLHADITFDGRTIYARSILAILSNHLLEKELCVTVDGDLSPFFEKQTVHLN